MSEPAPRERSVPWMPLVFMLFVLLLLGGVVALSYSPLIDHLFRTVDPKPPAPPPSDEVRGVPAPDNAITQPDAAPQREPVFPGPDNERTRGPQTRHNDASPSQSNRMGALA